MSDRRPEPKPEELRWVRCLCDGGHHREDLDDFCPYWGDDPVSTEALIAAVRAGVESGTIKGEVVEAAFEFSIETKSELIDASAGTYILIGPVDVPFPEVAE